MARQESTGLRRRAGGAVAVVLRESPGRGLGVFAGEPVRPGAVVLRFAGPRLRPEHVVDFSRALQVSRDEFLGPSGGIDDYVNHSCQPNCGIRQLSREEIVLVALEDVDAGQELTFDYSTCMIHEDWALACRCGAAACRGRITGFDRLPAESQARYRARGLVPRFILELSERGAQGT